MEDLLQELKEINDKKETLEEREKEIKESLEEDYLSEKGYKDDDVTISYVRSSSSTSIDTKKLKEKEPELYEDLLKDYPKVTSKKSSYKYSFK